MEYDKSALKKVSLFKEILTPPTQPNDKRWHDRDSLERTVYAFSKCFYDANVLDQNWMDFQDEASANYKKDGWIENLSIEKICSFLTVIVRKDRFSEGFLLMMVEDGIVAKLLARLQEVNE